jgi:hypothetical protein
MKWAGWWEPPRGVSAKQTLLRVAPARVSAFESGGHVHHEEKKWFVF